MTYEAELSIVGGGVFTTTVDGPNGGGDLGAVKKILYGMYGPDARINWVRVPKAPYVDPDSWLHKSKTVTASAPKESNLMPFLAGAAVGALVAKVTAPQPTILVTEPSYEDRIRLEREEAQAREDRIERANRKADEAEAREKRRWNSLTPEEQEAEFRATWHNKQVKQQRARAYSLTWDALGKDINARLDLSHLSGPFEWSGGRVLLPAEELVAIVEGVRTKMRDEQERAAEEKRRAIARAVVEEEAAAHPIRTAIRTTWIKLEGEEMYRLQCAVFPILFSFLAVFLIICGIWALFQTPPAPPLTTNNVVQETVVPTATPDPEISQEAIHNNLFSK
jgi:hypothetical protein